MYLWFGQFFEFVVRLCVCVCYLFDVGVDLNQWIGNWYLLVLFVVFDVLVLLLVFYGVVGVQGDLVFIVMLLEVGVDLNDGELLYYFVENLVCMWLLFEYGVWVGGMNVL